MLLACSARAPRRRIGASRRRRPLTVPPPCPAGNPPVTRVSSAAASRRMAARTRGDTALHVLLQEKKLVEDRHVGTPPRTQLVSAFFKRFIDASTVERDLMQAIKRARCPPRPSRLVAEVC